MGVDFGEARIGIALSDPTWTLATPHTVVASKDKGAQIALVAGLIAEHGVTTVVVGMPYMLDGSVGRMAEMVGKYVEKLARTTGVNIITRDERLTSWEAEQRIREGGGRRKKKQSRQAQKGRIDMAAATILLQNYLDAEPAP